MGFYLISFELAKIQMQDFAVCFVTIYYCRLQKLPDNSRAFTSNVQVGDNWSSTSIQTKPAYLNEDGYNIGFSLFRPRINHIAGISRSKKCSFFRSNYNKDVANNSKSRLIRICCFLLLRHNMVHGIMF